MWVFLPDGFFSIVAHRHEPENVMIRARNAQHLDHLFPGCEVTELDQADYRYRTVLPRNDVGACYLSAHRTQVASWRESEGKARRRATITHCKL